MNPSQILKSQLAMLSGAQHFLLGTIEGLDPSVAERLAAIARIHEHSGKEEQLLIDWCRAEGFTNDIVSNTLMMFRRC